MFCRITRRTFAAQASSQTIPLRLYNLEGRYATALYGAACKNDSLTLVESQLGKIKAAVKKSPQLQRFLQDPLMKRDQKREAVLAMLRGQDYCETVTSFFKVIADNGRLPCALKIIDSFEEIMKAYRGEVVVKITSATPLNNTQVETLKQIVRTNLLPREDPNLTPKTIVSVDPKIIGGLVIEVGDKTIDLSVSTRLAGINKALEESIYQ